jgi:hypothetical protein
MTREQKINVRAILDLAEARLRNPPLDPNVEHDLKEIVRLANELLPAVPNPTTDPGWRPA